MSEIKLLNNLMLLENFLGIYRNYCTQKKTKKFFITLQIFVVTITHIIILLIGSYFLLREQSFTFEIKYLYVFFSASSYFNAALFVMSGTFQSRAFKSYFESISRISERFKDERTTSFIRIFWLSLAAFLLSLSNAVTRSIQGFIYISQLHSMTILCPVLTSITLIRITIVFQYFIFYFLNVIVVRFLKCFTSLISAVQMRVGSCDISSDEQCEVTREQIQEWVELYRDLTNCFDKVTLMFGRQFFFSLMLSTARFILITYQMVYMKVNVENTYDVMKVMVTLFSYILLTMTTSVAGQMAKNEGIKFNRMLVRLYNTMIIDSNETGLKSIKDFIRLTKKNPIEIKLLSNLTAGMYILPFILTLAVNYDIVMLQYNHVI